MLELSSMHVNGGNTSNQSNTTRVPENHKNAERNTKMNTTKRELKNPFPPPAPEMTAWLLIMILNLQVPVEGSLFITTERLFGKLQGLSS